MSVRIKLISKIITLFSQKLQTLKIRKQFLYRFYNSFIFTHYKNNKYRKFQIALIIVKNASK